MNSRGNATGEPPLAGNSLRPGPETTAAGALPGSGPAVGGHEAVPHSGQVDADVLGELRAEVSERLSARLEQDRQAGRPGLDGDDQQLLARSLADEVLEDHARRCMASGRPVLGADEEDDYARAIDDSLFGLGHVLGRLLEDDSIENVNANGADNTWITRADGTKEAGPPLAASDAELVELIRTVAARKGLTERRFDLGSPTLNLRLPDGSRLFAVMGVTPWPSLSIRRHRYPKLFLSDLVGLGTIDAGLREFLAAAVRARRNVIVSGGTNSGKTTTLRALCNEIAPEERLVTIEDTFELGLERYAELHPDVVPMEVREANIEGEGVKTAADLVREGLRMAPDRVIVGEVRGDEVLPMLLAMTQGNDGSMCSVHADSSGGVFDRLAMYAVMTPERLGRAESSEVIANALDLVVFLTQERVGTGAVRRYVSSVREVRHAEGGDVVSNEVFRSGPDGRAVPAGTMSHATLERLEAAGYDRGWLERPQGWWDR